MISRRTSYLLRGALLSASTLAFVGCPPEPKPSAVANRPDAAAGSSDAAAADLDPRTVASATESPSADEPAAAEPTGDPTQPEFWDTGKPVEPLAPGDRARDPASNNGDAEPQAAADPEDDPNDWGDDGPGPGAVTTFPGIRIYKDEARLEVKGWLNLRRCPSLEFAACTRRGKTHETLLGFDLDSKNGGHQLHLALLMLGLQPTPQVSEQGEPIALGKGEKVVVEVSWRAEDSPEDPTAPPAVNGRVTRRLEDLIWDQRRRGAMPRAGWVFTGSQMVEVPQPPDWKTMEEVYAANYEGNLIATYHHPFAILDTPLIEGGDDTVYVPYSERLPERGTKLIVHVRPWRPGDGLETGAGAASDRERPDDGPAAGEGVPSGGEGAADDPVGEATPPDSSPTDSSPSGSSAPDDAPQAPPAGAGDAPTAPQAPPAGAGEAPAGPGDGAESSR